MSWRGQAHGFNFVAADVLASIVLRSSHVDEPLGRQGLQGRSIEVLEESPAASGHRSLSSGGH